MLCELVLPGALEYYSTSPPDAMVRRRCALGLLAMQLLIEDVDLGDLIHEVIVEQIANIPGVNSIVVTCDCL
jgi:hypothetical protein